MAKLSAGLLMYRYRNHRLEVLIVHPGGPYWAGKDDGVWSIPKGEYDEGVDPLEAAKREFLEETGITADGVFSAAFRIETNEWQKNICLGIRRRLQSLVH